MTSTAIPVLDASALPVGPPVPVPRPLDPAAGCAVVTLAVAAVALTDPGHPVWTATALALAGLTVAWGGGAAHRAAWAALRRGGVTADTLTTAGLLTLLGAAVATAAPGPTVVAAAAATLHSTGAALQARVQPDDEHRSTPALDHTAERAAAGFAAVVLAAAAAALGFRLGQGAGAANALGVAAAVLLAGCPRVAGRAAGAALAVGTAQAARLGALLDGRRTTASLARVDTVVLCRTGTLTSGARSLTAVHVPEGVDADEALRIAGAVAAAGREAGGVTGLHPVGAVVADAAIERFGELPGVAEYDGYPGLGVRGIVTELIVDADDEPRALAHAALVGRVDLLSAHGIALPDELATAVAKVHAAGATAVAVSWDGTARAVLEVADPVRPGAANIAPALRELGLTTVLLTGDDAGSARGLGTALGVDDVIAPAVDRGAAVAGLRAATRTVAVVGGPADRAALAQADVALTRQPASGAHVLLDDDPLTCVDAIRTARATMRTVERLLVAAAAYHLVALPAAAAGLLPPLAAAVAAAVFPVGALRHAGGLRRIRAVPRPEESEPAIT